MTEPDTNTGGEHQELSSRDGLPAEGSSTPPDDWRERAAFHVSIHSAADANGTTVWETRAYHEERDASMTWPGQPGEELIRWLIAVAEIPEGAPPAPAEPAPPAAAGQPETPAAAPRSTAEPTSGEPVDDFTLINGIGAITTRRLHEAGIRTYAQLAACSPEDLAQLAHIPAERIIKRGWIARARRKAGMDGQPEALAEPTPTELPASAGAALYVEVCFDDSGDILETRLLREQEGAPTSLAPEELHSARFFIDLAQVRPGSQPIEVLLELEDFELEELPGPHPAGIPRLRARTTLRVSGLGAEQILSQQASYLAYVLAYELETGATHVLHSTSGQLHAETFEEPLELVFALPAIGRYQMLLVAVLADTAALSAAAGPRLRVNP